SSAQDDPDCYDIEMVCKESTPSDEAALYPSLARGETIFRSAIARLAGAVRTATSATLGEPMTWHGTPLTRGELVLRVCFHNGCHAGQLVDLRRAMSLPNVIPS
ncbi:MAG: DinB family protein, partial [Planctomycetota bacterium]|nr:DinB family protein [Planctomycetota bacterium]